MANKFIKIPFKVLYNKQLSANAKLLFGQIMLLSKNGQCIAGNTYFSEVLGIGKIRVSQLLKQLKEQRLISVDIKRNENKQIEQRVIKIIISSIKKNANRAIKKNAKVNNTIIDTCKNNDNIYPFNYSELVVKCYESVVILFDEKLQPKTKTQQKKWLDTIDKLNRLDGYNPRQVYYITRETLKDDFWRKNFNSINKLRLINKEGVKYIDVFSAKFGKNMVV